MSKGLIGRKLGMTGVYTSEGHYVPVTVVQVGPCVVTQIKTLASDGYDALQLGFGSKKAHRINRPLRGHLAKSGGPEVAVLREFAAESPDSFDLGQELSVELFAVGERVDVSGTSKGRGFQGVIKRHGFARGRETHGSHDHREPGSIGCSAWPSKVIKGKKLPGQHGNSRRTVKNLQIVDIRPEQHLIMLRGAVPGARQGLVTIHKPTF